MKCAVKCRHPAVIIGTEASMIDITEPTERCCALQGEECEALIKTHCDKCKFYKPVGCHDWMRIKEDDRVILYTPEEYEERSIR